MKTKVINFAAGPSAGKTTNAMGLASHLKRMRKDVIYIPEYAMQVVVENRIQTLDDQLYIFAKQAHKLYDAKDHYEWVVTDAPLFMMLYYMQEANKKFDGPESMACWKKTLSDLILMTFNQYNNKTYFVDRGNREFRQLGRIHNFEQSKQIDREITQILSDKEIEYTEVNDLEQVIADLAETGWL